MKPRYFELAKKLAKKSDHHTFQIGCVIVHKNKIKALGFNQLKTHSKSIHKYNMLHAEIDAIIGSGDLSGCDAYVFRGNKTGKPRISKPCIACEQALIAAGIKKVYFSIDNKQGYDYIDLREKR
jgi:deoxycytidylate deaminase